MPNIDSVVLSDPGYGHLVLTAHNAENLTDAEWDNNYLRHVRERKDDALSGRLFNLVFAEGRGPNPKQRKVGNEIFGGEKYELTVGVVTSSIVVRGVVTALSWFNPLIRAFPVDGVSEALRYVSLPPQMEEQFYVAMSTLASRVPNVQVLKDAIAASKSRASSAVVSNV